MILWFTWKNFDEEHKDEKDIWETYSANIILILLFAEVLSIIIIIQTIIIPLHTILVFVFDYLEKKIVNFIKRF